MLLLWSKGPTQSSRERSGRWELSEEQPEDLDGRGGGLADRARRLLVPVGDALGWPSTAPSAGAHRGGVAPGV